MFPKLQNFLPLRRVLLALLMVLVASPLWAGSTTVVISQIYTAGGNSGATLNADYVELLNISAAPVSITGWAIQYGSAGGSTISALSPIVGTITLQPGQHYLIAAPAGTTGAAVSPAPDQIISNIAFAATTGRIYLTNTATQLASSCPGAGGTVVDFIGYGTASCYEGTAAAPATSTTLGDIRAGNGCTDTDQNSTDFTAVAPAPHNSSSTLTACGGGGTSSGISATGLATPSTVTQGTGTLLTVKVTAGTNPASTGITVMADLSAFGGSSTQPMYDDGTHGDVTSGDGTYSYSLTVPSNATLGAATIATAEADGQSRSATAGIALTIVAPVSLVPIHTVQGANPGASTYVGSTVTVAGIVTGITANGFYLQAKDSDADTDPKTSEGIFIHTGTGAVPTQAVVGNNLQVTGLVALFPLATATVQPGTEIDNPTAYTVLSTGNAMPTAITLTITNPSPSGGINQLFYYQSMRVAVPSLTTTNPTTGTLTETAETYVSTGQFWGTVTGVTRPVREPGLEVLSLFTVGQPSTIARFDDNPEVFELDSIAMTGGPGPIDITSNTVLTNVSGVMSFAAGAPLLILDATARPTVGAGMTLQPVRNAVAGEVTIGDQNIERFYNSVADTTGATVVTSAAYALRLSKVSLAIRNVLKFPDVMCLEEVENISVLNDISAKISADAIAASQTDPHYVAYLVQGNDTAGISVGYLVNPSKINVVSAVQYGLSTTFTQPSTGNSALLNDRPPYVLHVGVKRSGSADYPLTVIVNHLKSLDNVDASSGTGQNTRAKREQQAEFLANLIQSFQSAGEHVISVGDYNTFEFNDGIVDSFNIIRGVVTPATQTVVAGPTTALVSPAMVDAAPTNVATGTYSYVYNGNAQSIDHIIVTSDIAGITSTSAAHYNADFPAIYRNDSTRPEVGSDHDGIVAYIKVPGASVLSFNPTSLTFGTQVLNSSSATQSFTLTNGGATAITVSSVVASANFSQTNNCTASIAAGASCTIVVTFKPTVTGPITGNITFTDSDVSGTQVFPLSGIGAGIFSTTVLSASPSNVFVGATVTLTASVSGNAGTTPTGTITFLDGTTTLGSGAVAVNGSGVAALSVSTLGIATHSITAKYSGDGTYPTSTSSPSTVIVTAAPVPDFRFSISNPSITTIGVQTSVTTTADVAMINGFAATVSFTCAGLPAHSTCNFSPSTLTKSGSSILTVQINTAALDQHGLPFSKRDGTMLALLMLGLPLALHRKRVRSIVLGVLMLGAVLAGVTGCGSTPTGKGTSTVTVTATGGGVTHTATFTLNVQ